jgi:hypothetical protein
MSQPEVSLMLQTTTENRVNRNQQLIIPGLRKSEEYPSTEDVDSILTPIEKIQDDSTDESPEPETDHDSLLSPTEKDNTQANKSKPKKKFFNFNMNSFAPFKSANKVNYAHFLYSFIDNQRD